MREAQLKLACQIRLYKVKVTLFGESNLTANPSYTANVYRRFPTLCAAH